MWTSMDMMDTFPYRRERERIKILVYQKKKKRTAKHFILHKQVVEIQHWASATYRWWPNPEDHKIAYDPIPRVFFFFWMNYPLSPSPNMTFLFEEWVYSVNLFFKQVIPYHVNLEQTSKLTITLPKRIFWCMNKQNQG